ncbi:MAG: RNA recognition motif [Candidatus Omnitrophica bacterium ADurb.Bin205]|nr:MAG: RNA recognition motif [Candidatus Omnitrophica bacterium ADurb.Bin205]
MNIFVGNLSFTTTEADLKAMFEAFGDVTSAVIVMRKEKNGFKSRGFGFVEMPDERQALDAISSLNGKKFMGRMIDVNEACPKTKAQRKNELKRREEVKADSKAKARAMARKNSIEEKEKSKALLIPVIRRPGRYKGGRRTLSYMKKRYGLDILISNET